MKFFPVKFYTFLGLFFLAVSIHQKNWFWIIANSILSIVNITTWVKQK